MIDKIFSQQSLEFTLNVLKNEFPMAIWETVYVTVLATLFAILIGLPLGILLVTGSEKGIAPMPKWLYKLIDAIINLLRSVPFLILMILVIPLTRVIVGTSVGTKATIVPLVVAAFPFIARLAESCLREVDPNLIEMAQSLGMNSWQIVTRVMLPESVPALIANATTAITTILGYGAMSGILGGGGLGKIAIDYGYYRYKYLIMIFAVIALILLVQIFQSVGTSISIKSDKRLKH